jgi:hypothetical protein
VPLERQVGDAQVAGGAHAGLHLGDVRLDGVAAERPGDAHAVVPVADEVRLADLVEADRRHVLPAAHGLGDAFPPPAGQAAGGGEVAVEAALAVDRPDDRVERHRPQAERALADPPELGDDLVERQDEVDVARAAADRPAEPAQRLAPAGAQEVVRRVGGREPVSRATPAVSYCARPGATAVRSGTMSFPRRPLPRWTT